jgi:hypothetical protein
MHSSAKPDFSGEWVLVRQSSHLTGGASTMKTRVRIDHRDPKCGFQINMSAGGETAERAWESGLSDEMPVVDGGTTPGSLTSERCKFRDSLQSLKNCHPRFRPPPQQVY